MGMIGSKIGCALVLGKGLLRFLLNVLGCLIGMCRSKICCLLSETFTAPLVIEPQYPKNMTQGELIKHAHQFKFTCDLHLTFLIYDRALQLTEIPYYKKCPKEN